MFSSVLIANRGEIAVRIAFTARKLGVRSVAVYSTADANAMHIAVADEAVEIGGALPAESYLNIPAVINAAIQTGCEAVHPGYGFLSENPEFADACRAAGLIFIGPRSESLREMGHKDAAKQRMQDAGVPVVPGYHGDNQDEQYLLQQAQNTGYPLLIKARAGGGGKGMRLVQRADDFQHELASARREAMSAFGDDHVLLEKYITTPRHIEVQVFGDSLGNVVHLYERDCSLQRRHQKVIEESPAPGIDADFREAICQAAVTAAKSINYEGAGTVEFIVDAGGTISVDGFYFMEMNTRLQVEHPVTESVTGVDLVEWQFCVASGAPLPLTQQQIALTGHAVEARLYAEDVQAGFLPSTGTVKRLVWPDDGRIDCGIREGDTVLPFYDPMLAKLIATGADRQQAYAKLAGMLGKTAVLGTISNRDFLIRLCNNKRVLAGDVTTTLIEEHRGGWLESVDEQRIQAVAAVMLSVAPLTIQSNAALASTLGVWQHWGSAQRQCELLIDGKRAIVQMAQQSAVLWQVSHQQQVFEVELANAGDWHVGIDLKIDGQTQRAIAIQDREYLDISLGSTSSRVFLPQYHKGDDAGQPVAQLSAVMPGIVTEVFCAAGQEVSAGAPLLSMEAMKMEQTIVAPSHALIEQVCVEQGQQVAQGEVLVRFDFDDKGAK